MKNWVYYSSRLSSGFGRAIKYPNGVTQAEAQAMLHAAFNVFDRWDLSDDEAQSLLGNPSTPTFHRWKNRRVVRIPTDTVLRLGNILSIYKALRSMFTDPARGYAWVKKPNVVFLDKSALDVMFNGSSLGIIKVKNYLDAESGV